jgi:hypothetical protein
LCCVRVVRACASCYARVNILGRMSAALDSIRKVRQSLPAAMMEVFRDEVGPRSRLSPSRVCVVHCVCTQVLETIAGPEDAPLHALGRSTSFMNVSASTPTRAPARTGTSRCCRFSLQCVRRWKTVVVCASNLPGSTGNEAVLASPAGGGTLSTIGSPESATTPAPAPAAPPQQPTADPTST